jgi:hypothetical protein
VSHVYFAEAYHDTYNLPSWNVHTPAEKVGFFCTAAELNASS